MAALTRAQREAEADRKADADIVRSIRGMMGAAQLDQTRVAEMLGISRQTLARRLKRPGEFTVQELRRLCRVDKATGGGELEWHISA